MRLESGNAFEARHSLAPSLTSVLSLYPSSLHCRLLSGLLAGPQICQAGPASEPLPLLFSDIHAAPCFTPMWVLMKCPLLTKAFPNIFYDSPHLQHFLCAFPLNFLPCCCYVVAKLCLTLCDPMDCSLPGSSVPEISRQEYWSGLPCPSPGDLPDPGMEPTSPALAGGFFTATWEAWATEWIQPKSA